MKANEDVEGFKTEVKQLAFLNVFLNFVCSCRATLGKKKPNNAERETSTFCGAFHHFACTETVAIPNKRNGSTAGCSLSDQKQMLVYGDDFLP